MTGPTSRTWPEWSIWTSRQPDSKPTWWATRTRLLTESEMRSGLVHTLAADTETALIEQLTTQRGCVPEPSNDRQTTSSALFPEVATA